MLTLAFLYFVAVIVSGLFCYVDSSGGATPLTRFAFFFCLACCLSFLAMTIWMGWETLQK